jgi:hypothetical protein
MEWTREGGGADGAAQFFPFCNLGAGRDWMAKANPPPTKKKETW